MPTLEIGDIILVAQRMPQGVVQYYGTGFTAIQTVTAYWSQGRADWTARGLLSYKIATSGDSGSAIGGFANAGAEGAVVAVYRPSEPLTTVTLLNLSTSSLANPEGRTITASNSSLWTIAWCWSHGTITFTPTPDFDATSTYIKFKAIVQEPTATNVVANAGSATGNTTGYGYMEVS
tara:strand:- start:1257 stop:1787 length:531 start_codon:yes stop_codon:yes gene_type:complete